MVQGIHYFKIHISHTFFRRRLLGYVNDIQISSEYLGITDFEQGVIHC